MLTCNFSDAFFIKNIILYKYLNRLGKQSALNEAVQGLMHTFYGSEDQLFTAGTVPRFTGQEEREEDSR
jgi:hypothetical protein